MKNYNLYTLDGHYITTEKKRQMIPDDHARPQYSIFAGNRLHIAEKENDETEKRGNVIVTLGESNIWEEVEVVCLSDTQPSYSLSVSLCFPPCSG